MRAIILNRENNPAPEVIDIDGGNYKTIQSYVKGYFEVVYLKNDFTEMAYINEEGTLKNLTPMDVTFPGCRKIRLCGPILVLGGTDDGKTVHTKMDPDKIVWSLPDAEFCGSEVTTSGNVITHVGKWTDGFRQ